MEEENIKDKKTILIVDDEKPIMDILVYNLKKEGYETLEAADGATAVDIALDKKPDLILLDIMLPGMDGLTVCKKIRNTLNIPIIMLSAKDEEIDKTEKNKNPQQEDGHRIKVGQLELDLEKFEVRIGKTIIDLTLREFEVLKYLASQPGQVVTREVLLEKVWGYEYYGDIRTVDVTVRRIREKIEKDSNLPKMLITKRGVGYYIADK